MFSIPISVPFPNNSHLPGFPISVPISTQLTVPILLLCYSQSSPYSLFDLLLVLWSHRAPSNLYSQAIFSISVCPISLPFCPSLFVPILCSSSSDFRFHPIGSLFTILLQGGSHRPSSQFLSLSLLSQFHSLYPASV